MTTTLPFWVCAVGGTLIAAFLYLLVTVGRGEAIRDGDDGDDLGCLAMAFVWIAAIMAWIGSRIAP